MNKPIFIINDKKLFKEKNLVFFDIPLMFTCVDNFGTRYVVLLVDEELDRYILVSSEDEKLYDMLNGSMFMHDFFAAAEQKWTIVASECTAEDFVQKMDKFEENDLPVPGVAYQIENEEVAEFIKTLKSDFVKKYVEYSFLPKQFSITSFAVHFVREQLPIFLDIHAVNPDNYYKSPKFEISY